MLALCSILLGTYYAQNYAGIIDGSQMTSEMHMSAPVQFYSKVQYTYIACYNAGLLNFTWSGISECHFERCPWGTLFWQLFIKL